MKKTTLDLELRISDNLTALEQKVSTLKNGLSGLMSSAGAPKGLERTFESIETAIEKVRKKTSEPLTSKAQFDSVATEVTKIDSAFEKLIASIGDVSKLSPQLKGQLFSGDEKKRILDAANALDSYKAKLKEIDKTRADIGAQASTVETIGKQMAGKRMSLGKTNKAIDQKREQLSAAQKRGDTTSAQAIEKDIAGLEQKKAQLEAALTSLQSRSDSATGVLQTLNTQLANMQTQGLADLKNKAELLGVEFQELEGETPEQAMARLSKEIEGVLSSGLDRLPQKLSDFTDEARSAKQEVDSLGVEVNGAAEEFKEMDSAAQAGAAFESRIKQFIGVQGAAQLMRAALRDAIQTITELDKTMTEMAVVTDLGVGDYWRQLSEYSDRASELGVSINSAYQAATLFYQQGLKTNEVVQLSTETLKMARIAGLEAEDATNKMTAALRGFNMELDQASAKRVSDVYSELAAITASDVNEISSAMTKTASIASSAGMSFEVTSAFLSQIIETTRESAETAGTAMKTVVARFQELKKAPSEIGEIDGEIVDANKIDTALRSVGISLRDASGQFRDLDAVFLELAEKWDSLDKNTQRYVATVAAGSRQQSRFIAMMSNYARTQELVNAATNSAGASNAQFEKTLESMESKVEQLKNAWHEFTMGIINSDLAKFGIEVASKFLELVNKVTEGFNGIGSTFTKIGSLIAMFKLGMTVFEMIRPKLTAILMSVAQEFRGAGIKAGENFSQGVQQGTQNAKQKGNDNTQVQSAKYENGIKKADGAEESFKQKSLRRWGAIKANITQAGMAVMGVGMAFGMVSQALEKAGFDEAAKVFEQIGQFAMTAGSGMMIFGMVVNSLGPIFTKTGAAATAAGTSATVAWSPFLIAFIAIAAVALVIIGLLAVIAKTSPEAKLKEANKLVEEMGQAADKAKETFEELNESMDKLDNQQKTLKGLKKGTEEWYKAVKETNNAVIDLIQKYPELATLVTNQNGVLFLDVNSDKAKEIISKYESDVIAAEGSKYSAQIKKAESSLYYEYSKLKAVTSETLDTKSYEAVKELAKDMVGGQEIDKAYLYRYLRGKGVEDYKLDTFVDALEASKDSLIDFGQAVQNTEAQISSQHQAMVTSAFSAIDTSQYTEDQLNQMSNTIDDTAAKIFEQQMREEFSDFSKGERKKWLNEYAVDTYGVGAGVRNWRSVTNDQGEKVTRTLDQWETIYAGQKTEELLLEFMKQLPSITSKMTTSLQGQGKDEEADSLKKFFEDFDSLTREELDALNGLLEDKVAMGKLLIEVPEQYRGIIKAQLEEMGAAANEQFSKALEYAGQLNIDILGGLGSDAAHGWTSLLMKIFPASSQEEMGELNSALDLLLNGLTNEEVNNFMSLVNSVDPTDINSWESLIKQAKTLGITLDPKAFGDFAEAAKNASNAIKKINFEGLAEQVNNAYPLLEEIINGRRIYSEEEYNKLVELVPELEEDFHKIGEEFHYVRQSAIDLRQALESLTREEIEEGNRQLPIWKEMVGAMNEVRGDVGTPSGSWSEQQLEAYINTMRTAVWDKTQKDISELGIQGLANETKIEKLDYENALRIAQELAKWNDALIDEKEKNLIAATIEGFTYNTASSNALSATDGGDLASLYQKALIIQANRSGGVPAALIKQYEDVITGKADGDLEELGKKIAEQIESVIIEDENRNAYIDLINQVKDAIVTLRQEEIDKLSDIYDGIAEANEQLIDKIQEQIDEQRQARENEKTEEEIADKQARLAFLMSDTSGGNAVEIAQLQKEITEAQQDYTDTLVDQSIQDLQDANEKAAQQRERQIELLEAQLDYDKKYSITNEAVETVKKSLGELAKGTALGLTTMGEIIAAAGAWQYMSEEERKQATSTLQTQSANAANWLNKMPLSSLDLDADNTGGTKPPPPPTYLQGEEYETENGLNKTATLSPSDGFSLVMGPTWNGVFGQQSNQGALVGIGGGKYWIEWEESGGAVPSEVAERLDAVAPGTNPSFGIDNNNLYAHVNYKWYPVYTSKSPNVRDDVADKGAMAFDEFKKLVKYKTGGLADFTGPAWLDGTKSKPELVLNQQDTANFIVLKDVLAEVLNGSSTPSKKSSGDNYYDIDISVDKIGDDYDVDQLADKIRRMLYDDASYRNVNAINNLR